jgi:excisionase family DNA binding protein
VNTNDLNETLPHVLTTAEFGHEARCSKSKTYRLIREKKIQSVKVGRRILIPRAALVAMLTPKDAA